MIDRRKIGTFAVVTIDNPPVNAGSHAVRQGLIAAFAEIAADASLAGVVLVGAGKTFISGSDIREFGKPLSDPQLPAVIEAIENLAIPVAAAIRGAALGGGYELSLGCDLRIADSNAVVGLPEVGLGLVPGAGGTQRLPRLTGVPVALELAVSARRVKAPEALSLGMIDAISSGDLVEDAIAALRALGGKRRVADMPLPPCDGEEALRIRAEVVARAKGRPAAVKAADLVLMSADKPFRQALAEERAVFQEIRVSPEAFAYRHAFFAERDAARPDNADAAAADVRVVAVIGGGTMGAGIAHSFLSAGYRVVLVERDDEALAAGAARIAGLRTEDLARGRLDEAGVARQAAALTGSADLADVVAADLIIEAVFEDITVKRELLRRLGTVASADAVIATNTSYLDIDAMAEDVPHPKRFLGLHFFAPAHVMKLLEIVKGASTGDKAVATALAVAKRLGKQAVIARNAYGFIGNRIYNAYRRHAEFLVQDGATPQAVDRAMRNFGMAMGPFAVADLSGLDIAWRMRKAQAATRDPAMRYVDILDRLCEAGRLGRKAGAGYYTYASGKAEPDPAIEFHIEASRTAAGIVARPIGDDEIRARCLCAMVNEGALLLAEGVARQASDIDVALIHGYGFPRWTGGPVWWAAHLNAAERKAMLQRVAEAEGTGFKPGDVDSLVAGLT
ncbi:3-hydroxyacyl-CoA dehydrogenase NAD-binding domain-containing protein [Rhizobium sp. RU36D]|uniref:3-hydroxyacyl-CoA dehydrogenase NAD-binding domain-containing protein n=1 Tax=Rhizobium sp. RU36D TaxID=1907415 RepID=UPI0009D8299B|nr:3-hydroxyacyl-CoA dehydrogenase NAD-binding domain-containing protein [Rhizobium sp. RU36D]SMD12785.1 3-hydroxyacyl-CoA dehydrogenase [Rhizobium sp. RU36D]